MKKIIGRWQLTVNRTGVGGVLFSLTHHDHSWQVHAHKFTHRPFSRRA